jgi:NAD(P)H dehydrogenase (quinone)
MLPILVTGAAGRVGGVGRSVVELLRQRGLPVRAFVHHDDERAASLRAIGAEIVVGDLTSVEDVRRALDGVRRIYFSLSASPEYLEATITTAALARDLGEREVFLNMSQMTVSQMSETQTTTDSPQHRQHWLAEQALNWSGLPVVHLRPTVFLENPLFLALAAQSIDADSTLRLPFGNGRSSPVSASDVASVAAAILANPAPYVGHVYELTGPVSEDMNAVAAEYSSALGRTIRYVDVPFDQWCDLVLRPQHWPEHLTRHIATMARLHAANRYDRLTHDVETITGRPATSVHDFVASHADLFSHPAEASARV